MNVLIYSGTHPFLQADYMSLLTRKENCGANLGNLMFINAVAEAINVDHNIHFIPTHYRSSFSEREIEWINNECSYFVMPMADAFRDDNIQTLTALTKTIQKLKIPCVVVGVGLRAPYQHDVTERFAFDDEVKNFLRAVLDKSAVVGLRGENTARYLSGLGFQEGCDFEVIGCPSMCMSPVGGESTEKVTLSANTHIGVNANDLAPAFVNSFFQDILLRYPNSEVVQQRECEIIDLYLSKYSTYKDKLFRIDGTLYGAELYEHLKTDKRVKAFSNVYDWIDYCRSFDFCISNRFHGTVASLYAGTPSVIIPIDSRMDELVRYHKLPYILMDQIRNGERIEDVIDSVDLKSYLTVREENCDRFFAFLEENGLPHITTADIRGLVYEGNPENQTEKYFDQLTPFEKSIRVMKYYYGRIWEKARRNKPLWKD